MGIFERKRMMERQVVKEANLAIYEMDQEADAIDAHKKNLRAGLVQQRKNRMLQPRQPAPQRGMRFANRVRSNMMRK